MSGSFRPTRKQIAEVNRLARLCEIHAGCAAEMAAAKRPGAWLAHDGIARDYSSVAFALSARVATEGQRALARAVPAL